jgi:hypothetical protein
MKPGYKTISFWLALGVTILGGLSASGVVPEVGLLPSGLTLIVTVLAAAGYSSVRAWAKGPDGKPAWKSTEFWLSLLAVAIGGTMAGGFFPESSAVGKGLALVATLMAALGYAVPRAFGQQMPPKG